MLSPNTSTSTEYTLRPVCRCRQQFQLAFSGVCMRVAYTFDTVFISKILYSSTTNKSVSSKVIQKSDVNMSALVYRMAEHILQSRLKHT